VSATLGGTPAPAPARRSRGSTAARVAVVGACALIAAMWIYAFGFASKEAAYRVRDEAWRDRAEEICDRYRRERFALADTDEGFITDPTPEQMRERADIVDRATDLLEASLVEQTALALPTARDQELVDDYRGFWEVLLGDRRAYTARLREGRLEPYRETKLDGGPVTNVIVDFTTVNEIRSCAPPQELRD